MDRYFENRRPFGSQSWWYAKHKSQYLEFRQESRVAHTCKDGNGRFYCTDFRVSRYDGFPNYNRTYYWHFVPQTGAMDHIGIWVPFPQWAFSTTSEPKNTPELIIFGL